MPKFSVGTKVRKFFEHSGWFTGKVVSHDGTYYNVEYNDGDSEDYSDEELSAIVLTPELEKVGIGSRVAVYRSSDDQYYEATVTRERISRKPLYLEFDDQGEGHWMNLFDEQFLLLEEPERRRSRLKHNRHNVGAALKGNKRLVDVAVGSRIAVYRPSTDHYYDATITRDSEDEDSTYYCQYSTGDGEWIDLGKRDFISISLEEEKSTCSHVCHSGTSQKKQAESAQSSKSVSQPMHEVNHKVTPPSHVLKKEEDDNMVERVGAPSTKKVRKKPRPAWRRPSAATAVSPELEQVDIGSRVAVYNPNDDKYHEAVVTQRRYVKKPFFLEYSNGDCEWVDFNRHNFYILNDEETVLPGRRKHKQDESKKIGNMIKEEDPLVGSKRRRVKGIKGKAEPMEATKNASATDDLTKGELSSGSAGKKYSIGTKVKKFFDGYGWYEGEVSSFNGSRYRVIYKDGDGEDLTEETLSAIVLSPELEKAEVGLRIAVQWPSDNVLYEATIVRENPTSRKPYLVEYDTGHHEWLDLRKVEFCLLGGGTRRRKDTVVEEESDSDVDRAGHLIV